MTSLDELEQEAIARDRATKKLEYLKSLRAEIAANAGDQQALLGTTSDATQLVLFGFCSLISKLNNARSLSDVRMSTSDFSEIAQQFLERLEAGEIKLPFQAKGRSKVIEDIQTRGTAVAESIENAKKTKHIELTEIERLKEIERIMGEVSA